MPGKKDTELPWRMPTVLHEECQTRFWRMPTVHVLHEECKLGSEERQLSCMKKAELSWRMLNSFLKNAELSWSMEKNRNMDVKSGQYDQLQPQKRRLLEERVSI